MTLQILPQEPEGALAGLFRGLGTGLGEGLQTGVKSFFDRKNIISSLTPTLGEKGATAVANAPKEFRGPLFKALFEQPKQIAKARGAIQKDISNTFKSFGLDLPEADALLDLRKKAQSELQRTGDPLSAQNVATQSIEEDIKKTSEEKVKEIAEPGIFKRKGEAFLRGATRESVAASITGNQLSPEEIRDLQEKDPSLMDGVAETLGTVAADLPFYAAGATIGTAIGGPKIGTVGAFVLPALIRSTADEVWKALRDEDKFTLQKGGDAALRVANKVAKATIQGVTLGELPGFFKLAGKIPGAEKVLGNELAQSILNTAGTVTALAATEPALEGRLPTGEEFSNALIFTLGFEVAGRGLPRGLKRRIEKEAAKTDLSPTEFAEKVKDVAEERGLGEKDLQKDLRKLDRVVRDVTKEFEPAREKVAEVFEKERPELKLKLKEEEALPLRLREAKPRPPTVLRETVIPQTTIETLGAKRPETLIKQERRFQELTPKINEMQQEIRRTARDINQVRQAIEKTTDSELKTKLQDREQLAFSRLKSQQQQLRGIEKELKTGRPAQTEGQIRNQAETSVNKLENTIKEGKETLTPKERAAQRQVARDASNLRKQRKSVADVPKDTYTRVNEGYKDFYKAKIEDLNDFIDNNVGSKVKAVQKRVANAKKTISALKDRISGINDKLTIHKHKLKEIQTQQKKIDKLIKIEERARRARVEEVAKPALSETAKFIENPTEAAGKKLAEEAGVSFESVKESAERIAEEMADSNTTEEDIRRRIKEEAEKLNKESKEKAKEKEAPKKEKAKTKEEKAKEKAAAKEKADALRRKERKRKTITGLLFGAARTAIKLTTGITVPSRGLGKLLGAGTLAAASVRGATILIIRVYQKIRKEVRINEFKNALASGSPIKVDNVKRKFQKQGLTKGRITALKNEARRRRAA